MLKQRILTALILLPIVIGSILVGPYWLVLALSASIFLLAANEWSNVNQFKPQLKSLLLLTCVALGFLGLNHFNIMWVLAVAAVWWLLSIGLLCRAQSAKVWLAARHWAFIIGCVVIAPSFVAMIYLQQIEGWLLLYACVLVWGADTGAYFAGRRFGKTKLAPSVSPGKSWEGVFGALALTVLICYLAFKFLPFGLSFTSLLALSLITVVFSIVGDLAESLFKRIHGVKDSGNLLPGHGGVLDRIDSLTAAFPVFALGWMLLHTA